MSTLSSTSTDNCCDDVTLTDYNPKEYNYSRTQTADVKFQSVQAPIPDQVKDRDELAQFFRVHGQIFIPYAGTSQQSSHSLLTLLYALKENSPTQGNVINRIKSYALGGLIDIVNKVDPVFDIQEERGDVAPVRKAAFRDAIKQIKFYGEDERETNLRNFAYHGFEDYKISGDFYIELVFSETLGVRSASVYAHCPLNVLYLLTDKGEQKYVGVSPKWTDDYINRYPPEILPLYPAFVEKEDGTRRTMMHFKNGNGVWYGRPDSLQSLMSQFQEFLNRDYKTKATQNQFVGAGLIEVEDDDLEKMTADGMAAMDEGFAGLADRIDKKFTMKSDTPQSFMVMSRPYGAKEAFVHEFKANTQEGWFESTDTAARKDIIEAHKWSERLMGESQAGGFSSNVFLDELRVLGMPTLKEAQNIMGHATEKVLTECMEWLGISEFDDLSVSFTSPFDKQLREMMDDEENNNNGNDNTNNGVGGNQV